MIKRKKTFLDPIEEFISLSDAEKHRVYAEIDAMSEKEIRAQSRPLNSKKRAEWTALQKNEAGASPARAAEDRKRRCQSVAEH